MDMKWEVISHWRYACLFQQLQNWKHPVHVNISQCQFDNKANYRYNQEIYNGQEIALNNETSNSISQPNSFQLLKQQTVYRWKVKLIILNWGIHRSRYYPWQFVFLFIALSSCCYTERSMNFSFSVLLF